MQEKTKRITKTIMTPVKVPIIGQAITEANPANQTATIKLPIVNLESMPSLFRSSSVFLFHIFGNLTPATGARALFARPSERSERLIALVYARHGH